MTTFGIMLDRIADEVARSDLGSQTQLCIKSAIKHYQHKRFYFNEDYSTSFNTVAGQEYYSSSDNAAIPYFSTIDSMVLTDSGSRWPLETKPKEWFDNVSSSTSLTGIPSHYLYYGMKIRLYPIPQTVYSIRVDGLKRLDEVSATADTNVWFTEGEELIRNAAKKRLFLDYLKDDDAATRAGISEKAALDEILQETIARAKSNITPTQF